LLCASATNAAGHTLPVRIGYGANRLGVYAHRLNTIEPAIRWCDPTDRSPSIVNRLPLQGCLTPSCVCTQKPTCHDFTPRVCSPHASALRIQTLRVFLPFARVGCLPTPILFQIVSGVTAH